VKTTVFVVLSGLALLAGACSAPYYSAMEKLGIPKREILVDRIQATRDSQEKAKEQFTSALERFQAVTGAQGGELQQKYDELNREFSRSESRANDVRERIKAVEDVAEALFSEWKQELKQYSDPTLRRESERQYDRTRSRYDELIRLMRRSAERMDPVLGRFRDQVLFLKHNLNAQALASLTNTQREIEADVNRLIADMEASMRNADAFIQTLRQENAAHAP
jgi:hypothetical protein